MDEDACNWQCYARKYSVYNMCSKFLEPTVMEIRCYDWAIQNCQVFFHAHVLVTTDIAATTSSYNCVNLLTENPSLFGIIVHKVWRKGLVHFMLKRQSLMTYLSSYGARFFRKCLSCPTGTVPWSSWSLDLSTINYFL